METLIEKLIIDFQERPLPSVEAREITLPNITGKVDTIIGMRRTGKTFLLYQRMHTLLKEGFPKENILYINFDDERLAPLKLEDLHLVTDIYYRLFPEKKKTKSYFFFDEIQNIEGWERYIRRLLDTENVHITITGSSAKLLSKEIATNLRGRGISTEVFPYSFREKLLHENPNITFNRSPGSEVRAWMSNRFRSFLIQGGFPEIQSIEEIFRFKVLQEYVSIVILRDIIERHNIANIQALNAMTNYLLNNTSSLFSVNKFYNDLKTQGLRCTKNDLYVYLDHLHDAYLIYPVSVFSQSERIRRQNPRKTYCIDTGLINAFSHQPQMDFGKLLENFVFITLRRHESKIEYYRTEKNTEVDFITTSLKGEHALYQVSLNLEKSTTRDREIRALETAMQECGLKTAKIITLEHKEIIKTENGTIEILPVWEWATNWKSNEAFQ